MSSLTVLKWTMWQRNRKILPAIAIYLLLCGPLLIAANRGIIHENFVAFFILPGVFAFLSLFGIFIHQDADVGTKGSCFPTYLFQLPLKTWKLVLPPMAIGSVTMAAIVEYIILVIEADRVNLGSHLPVFVVVAMLAMLQAIFWFPIGVSYSKMVLTIVGVPLIPYVTATLRYEKLSPINVELILIVFTAAMYALAWEGVHRARLGENRVANIEPADRPVKASTLTLQKPFRNANVAQRWYEWRQHGLMLPAVTLILFILFIIPLHYDTTKSTMWELRQEGNPVLPTVGTVVRYYFPIIIGAIPALAWFIGCGARRSDVKGTDRTLHLFFGVRPMSDAKMIQAKVRTAIKSSLVAWGVALVCTAILLVALQGGMIDTAQYIYIGKGNQPLISVLAPYLSTQVLLFIAGMFTLLIATTIRNYIVGLWLDLSGIPWISIVYPWAIIFATIGGTALNSWLSKEKHFSEINFFYCWLFVIWTAVLLKLILALRLALIQVKSGLINRPTFFRGLVAYFAYAGLLTAIVLGMFRELWMRIPEFYGCTQFTAAMLFVGFTIFWTPIYRVVLATTMLERNRHRNG